MEKFVVVFDPDGVLPEGLVLVSDERYFAAVHRRVVFLPVTEDAGRVSISNWAKFSYGSGPSASETAPGYLGRASLWLERGRGSVAWAALFRFPVGAQPEGLFRLVGDPKQPPFISAPVVDDGRNRASLGRPFDRGDTYAILSGRTQCQTACEGVFAFALHGYARECRLSWFAVSQTE